MTDQLFQIKNLMQNSRLTRVLSHLFFWVLIAIFYFFLFSWNNEFREITIIFSAGLLPVAIVVTYFFNYILVPKYLWNKRYGRFFLLSFYTLLVAVWCSFLIVFYALIFFLNKESAIAPSVLRPELQVITQNFVVFLAISIKQIKRSFFIQQENYQLEKTKLTTGLKLKEAKLKLLKAQIQPHFLFNTLNNLYGLTLEKSDKAPNLVLQLSDILDYILYQCNDEFVSLSKEIKNLSNYMEIEKIRYTRKLSVEIKVPGEIGEIKIAPLLLIPFIENAFKHGVSNNPGKSFIRMKIETDGDDLRFQICNSKNPIKYSGVNGIGLENVKKRLELIYPERYELEIVDRESEFCVHLFLKTTTDV